MTTRTITRIAATTIAVAALSLTLSTPADAINKHETGGKSTQGQCLSQQLPWTGRSFALGHPPESP